MKIKNRFSIYLMEWLGNIIYKNYKKIIILWLILFIASIVFSNLLMEMRTNVKDLLPKNHKVSSAFEDILDNYDSASTLLVAVEGKSKERMKEFADEFVRVIKNDQYLQSNFVKTIDAKLKKDFLKKHMLLLIKTKNLKKLKELYSNPNLIPFVTQLNNNFEKTYGYEGDEDINNNKKLDEAVQYVSNIEDFITVMDDYIKNGSIDNAEQTAKKLVESMVYGERYYFNHDNSIMLINIIPKISIDDINESVEFVTKLEEIGNKLTKKRFGDIEFGITGMIAVAKAEMTAAEHDMSYPTLIALLLIIILFVISFNRFRATILAIISLIFGITLTTGIHAVVFGELNLMTSMFWDSHHHRIY